jgi:transketolase
MGELGGVISNDLVEVSYVSSAEVASVLKEIDDPILKGKVFAEINRLNTLSMIMEAGSGHIGSSFSAMDIVSHLWLNELKNPNQADKKHSDTYFSSKGHDAPGLYSVLIGLGLLSEKLLHSLRRLEGLPGHPDVSTPYMSTNTGSLGMGISKAHGMALARRALKKTGRFYVLLGDGELQEGQFWESLQPVANAGISEITAIIDHNKIQSDTLVSETSDLGDLKGKLESFGWHVMRINGNDIAEVSDALTKCSKTLHKPQIIIADTVKGKGVSFMEKLDEDGYYKFHSGAPSVESYKAALKELKNSIQLLASKPKIGFMNISIPAKSKPKNPQKLIGAYSKKIVELGRKHKDIVAMDADLVLDTGLIPFKEQLPDRYVQAGIAEQDMVSRAGGLALQGLLPIVHSFACFLTTRANEQIYNNATENKKIIYVGSLAGILPGSPGHSHQSVRDISAIGSIPGLLLLEPSCEQEVECALDWAVEENDESTYIRIVSIPVETSYKLPANYRLEKGKGVVLSPGSQVAIVAYGPVMLNEACKAAFQLKKKGVSTCVVNLPWLNYVDGEWAYGALKDFSLIVTLDDHYKKLGQSAILAQTLINYLDSPKILSLGIETVPVCGRNEEVLSHHKLDANSIANHIMGRLEN